MSFEWQTEDDDWRGPPPAAPEPPPAEKPLWAWLGLGLLVFLGLSAGIFIIYQQANNRVEDVESRLEADVLTSHRLVRLAAAEADYELFVQMLSGRDPQWVAVQRELLQEGMLFNRPGLGMTLVQPTEEPEIIDLTLSPNLATAYLKTADAYAIDIGNGLTDTVVLTHSIEYRLGPDNWLYAPPLEDTWGDWVVRKGRFLTVIFPESEAKIAGRLAFDLETKLIELCVRVPGNNCPENVHRTVRLSKEPDSLLLNSSINTLSGYSLENEIELPTPHLVGAPVDEDGYRAMLRGYAYHVVGSAFLELVAYDCCDHVPYAQALVEWQLADMALFPRPVYKGAYAQLVQDRVDIFKPFPGWDMNEDRPDSVEVRQAAAVIAFIRHISPEIGLAQIARSMEQAVSYWDWLRELAPSLVTDEDFLRAWMEFLEARSAVNDQSWPARMRTGRLGE